MIMVKTEEKFLVIRQFCEKNANTELAKKYERYFVEGYDAYGLSSDIITSQRDEWMNSWKEELTTDDYILLGNRLVSTGKYEEASFAILFLIELKNRLTAGHFNSIGHHPGLHRWCASFANNLNDRGYRC